MGLKRYGQTGTDSYGLVDNLAIALNGNQLLSVNDAVAPSAYNNGFEFRDGAKVATEYAYDSNGYLAKDLNKSISNIQYNCLNLPGSVTFADGSTITYIYAFDFKTRNIENIPEGQKGIYKYRGMPFKGSNGKITYASARDIGNFGAGYIAGKSGLSWKTARMGFDALESSQTRGISTEGMTTQKAERLGYNEGSQNYGLKRASDFFKRLFNIPMSKPRGFLGS